MASVRTGSRINAPITGPGGDGNVLGRFYDITEIKDGWDRRVHSSANTGVAVGLLITFRPSFSLMKDQQSGSAVHVPVAGNHTGVCTKLPLSGRRPASAWRGCLLSKSL